MTFLRRLLTLGSHASHEMLTLVSHESPEMLTLVSHESPETLTLGCDFEFLVNLTFLALILICDNH